MAVDTKTLVSYLDKYLRISDIPDYGPQGVQVEAEANEIKKIALAVDVAPPIITAAAEWGADMFLVHHGIFWGGQEPIAGPLGERVRRLLKHNIHLYSAHLPLDAHPEVGNNAVLGDMLGLENRAWWGDFKGTPLALVGERPPLPVEELAKLLERGLNTGIRLLKHGPDLARRIAVLSGFGVDHVREARAQGADTFVTGETSHAHYWQAADYGINVIFGGHYATETVGVQALGRHLTEKFGVDCQFLDYPTQM